jgi:uncharacterized protein YkwD
MKKLQLFVPFGKRFLLKDRPGLGAVFFAFTCSISLSQTIWHHSDYQKTTYKNFRRNPLFNQLIDFDRIDYPLLHAAIFFMTNEARVRSARHPVEFALELERAAYHHSKYMAEQNFFAHENPYSNRRNTADQRAKLAGITNPLLAENIATHFGIKYKPATPVYPVDREQGTFSYEPDGALIPHHTYLSFAEAIVAQWMDSPPHRANILSPDALQLGCGAYFYHDANFHNMPTFKATQNFQLFKKIVPGKVTDQWP